MERVIGEYDLGICHAGNTTVAAMLVHGKPLVLLLQQVEQAIIVRRAANAGMASIIASRPTCVESRSIILHTIEGPPATRAADCARQNPRYLYPGPVDGISERCLELLAEGR